MRRLTTFLILAALVSVAAGFLGAEEPDKDKKKQEDALEILKKVGKLMREIENDLAKASVKEDTARKAEQVRQEIEKLLKSGKDQKDVQKELEKLLQQAGASGSEAAKELEKLLKAGQGQAEVAEAIKKLLEATQKGGQAQEKIEKLFQLSLSKQDKALQKIEEILKNAKRYQEMEGQSQEEQDKKKPKQKEDKKDQKKEKEDPQNSKKESPKDKKDQAQKDYDPKQPKDPKVPEKKLDKTGRWGSLQDRTFGAADSGEKSAMPEKYRKLIELYYKSIQGNRKDSGK